MACFHKTARDHSNQAPDGTRVWTCTNCGHTDRWSSSWSYFGNIECTGGYGPYGGCGWAAIDYVACSPKCETALANNKGMTR